MKKVFRRYFELAFWLCSIMLLALAPPGSGTHYSLCLFKIAGISFCPGCGLGHSISYLLQGNIRASFSAHPLGFFALVIILYRVYKLTLLNLFTQKIKNNYATR